ncbi:MAG TPA: MurT ligase domain-containing protein [Bacillota bacterium]
MAPSRRIEGPLGPRGLVAVWLAKSIIRLSRVLGLGGSTFPGTVARRLAPGILGALSAGLPKGVILVTGTNGKTTTARMIAGVLRAAGLKVVHNRSGANLITGVTAAFIDATDWRGRLDADIGLVECDEATVPKAVSELPVRILLVTNFFRDQLDRFGELAHTVELVRSGAARLDDGARLLLNADDPLVAGIGRNVDIPAVYYGIDDERQGAPRMVQAREAKHCLECGEPYDYKVYYYAHLGKYRCPRCGRDRPRPDVAATAIELDEVSGSRLTVRTADGPELDLTISLPGLYNAYNALAAATAGLAAGAGPEAIRSGLAEASSSFGRMEPIDVDGRRVLIALVKNPVGFNEVVRTVLGDRGAKRLVIAINDNYADGTDVSWLWDVDFEQLAAAHAEIDFVVTSGIRAEDMAVRLKYAGVETNRISVEEDISAALALALGRVEAGQTLYVLPTYTAMLEVRRVIQRMGYARPFWQA